MNNQHFINLELQLYKKKFKYCEFMIICCGKMVVGGAAQWGIALYPPLLYSRDPYPKTKAKNFSVFWIFENSIFGGCFVLAVMDFRSRYAGGPLRSL